MIYLVAGLTFSITTNAYLVYLLKYRKPKHKLEKTYDVQMLLRDLSTGPAYIKMQYLDRDEMFMVSPREYK